MKIENFSVEWTDNYDGRGPYQIVRVSLNQETEGYKWFAISVYNEGIKINQIGWDGISVDSGKVCVGRDLKDIPNYIRKECDRRLKLWAFE